MKAYLIPVAAGEEIGEFVNGLRTVLNERQLPYPPCVLPWSTAHSPECDRSGGGACARCEARSAIDEIRTRSPGALGAVEAYHEAGHAVVGFSLGLEINEATVIPYGTGWGWVIFRHFEDFRPDFLREQPLLARAYAVSLLAGPMSQARHSGCTTGELAKFCRQDMEPLGGRRDLRRWDQVARALPLNVTESEFWVECRSQVLLRFDDPKICAAIDFVAQQLQGAKHFRDGELNGDLADVECPVVPQRVQ
ncbi:MAG: hypothetical protein ACJ8GN_04125 [Longimicrobiaceae bacterium]